MGTVFASNGKAYAKWRTSVRPTTQAGLTGAPLEAAVMRIASIFPGNVERVTA